MNEKKLKRLESQASDRLDRLESKCSDMAIMFQPFFDCEISVFYQHSDGFVVMWEENNDNVFDAMRNIQQNPNHYKED